MGVRVWWCEEETRQRNKRAHKRREKGKIRKKDNNKEKHKVEKRGSIKQFGFCCSDLNSLSTFADLRSIPATLSAVPKTASAEF